MWQFDAHGHRYKYTRMGMSGGRTRTREWIWWTGKLFSIFFYKFIYFCSIEGRDFPANELKDVCLVEVMHGETWQRRQRAYEINKMMFSLFIICYAYDCYEHCLHLYWQDGARLSLRAIRRSFTLLFRFISVVSVWILFFTDDGDDFDLKNENRVWHFKRGGGNTMGAGGLHPSLYSLLPL